MGARLSDIVDALPGGAEDRSPPAHAEILRGVADGDPSANAALYDALSPVVVRTLQKILRDPSADYEDLVQTTFERIVRTLVERGTGSVSHLAAWGAGIAAHVALDALRAKIRERKLFFREASTERGAEWVVAPSLERQLEARRKLAWVQGALARMNADHAQALLLHDVLGHDLAETASIAGVSLAAAQKRLSRARQELLRRAKNGEKGGKP
ncbi:MAG TPA: RNA polymerase sigma factor [Polyangiaceae bacterium]